MALAAKAAGAFLLFRKLEQIRLKVECVLGSGVPLPRKSGLKRDKVCENSNTMCFPEEMKGTAVTSEDKAPICGVV